MIFKSKAKELRVVVKPSRFTDVEGSRFLKEGVSCQFINGVFETDDKDLITALKEGKYHGSEYFSEDTVKVELSREMAKEINEIKGANAVNEVNTSGKVVKKITETQVKS